MDLIWTVGWAAVGGVGAVLALPAIVTIAGFGAAGIAAGSMAASLMSMSAIANGGGVVAGGIVAILQAIGATGALSYVVTAAVGAGGAIVGAVVGGT